MAVMPVLDAKQFVDMVVNFNFAVAELLPTLPSKWIHVNVFVDVCAVGESVELFKKTLEARANEYYSNGKPIGLEVAIAVARVWISTYYWLWKLLCVELLHNNDLSN